MRHIITVLFILFFNFQSFSANLVASDVLKKFGENQDKFSSFIMTVEETTHSDISLSGSNANISGKYTKHEQWHKACDGNLLKYRRTSWGDVSRFKNIPSKDSAMNISYLWDGKQFASYSYSSDTDPGSLKITQDLSSAKLKGESNKISCYCRADGYFSGCARLRLDKFFSAHQGIASTSYEHLNDVNCIVLESKGKYGDYTIWLDPEKGYSILKAKVVKDIGDYRSVESTKLLDKKSIHYIDNVQLKNIDGVWIPLAFRFREESEYPNGDYAKLEKQFKRISVLLNPDHESLGSFEMDNIRDGARVRIISQPYIEYTWQKGKIVPKIDKIAIAQLDLMAEEILTKKEFQKSLQNPITYCSVALETIIKEYCKVQEQLGLFYCEGGYTEGGKQILNDLYTCNGMSWGVQIITDNTIVDSFSWDGRQVIHYFNGALVAFSSAEKAHQLLATTYSGSPLLGYLNGCSKRIDMLFLESSKKAKVSEEKLDDQMCYVVTVLIDNESWRVWFSPEQNYHVVKAEIQKGSQLLYSLDQVIFQTIDDILVPVSCVVKIPSHQYTYERTKIELKSNFTAIRALTLN